MLWLCCGVGCAAGKPGPAPSAVPPSAPRQAPAATERSVVVGVVETADGAPAADAVIAVNELTGESGEIVVADAQGRFEAKRPTQPFAVTATSPKGTAVFVPAPDTGAEGELRIRLAPVSEALTISGSLSVAGGDVPKDTFIYAARVSSDSGDIFRTVVSASGEFSLLVPAGRYSLHPGTDELLARWSVAEGSAGGRQAVRIEASLRAPPSLEVVRGLRESALPIATTDVHSGTGDVAALADLLAQARVIGVGEATHGTREFFRLKHRVLQRLVTHHGLRLLAMEANFSDAERIDAWVRSGEGTIEDAMKGLFVVWRTEEVKELLLWIRQYNADPAHRDKVGVRGYDAQGASASVAAVRAYLQRVDPTAEAELLDPLQSLHAKPDGSSVNELTDAEAASLRKAVAAVAERLSRFRRKYVARSSVAEHAVMLQHTRAMEQVRRRLAAKGNAARFAARDLAMADNVMWLADQIGEEQRMMVWAHNGHIQFDHSTLLGKNMGTYLRERLGPAYLATGFVLGEGTYRAWVKPTAPDLADVAVGPIEPGWAAQAFAETGLPIFAVDLRSVTQGPVHDWVFSPHIVHSCGWLVSEHEPKGTVDVLGRLFDVAIYINKTSSARQLPRG